MRDQVVARLENPLDANEEFLLMDHDGVVVIWRHDIRYGVIESLSPAPPHPSESHRPVM